MHDSIQKAQVLVEALPYIREFNGKTVVIKYGGAAMLDPELRRSTAEDIVLMNYVGMNPVVVHGGGPNITAMLDKLAIPATFEQGMRVTTGEAVEVVEMVLAGQVNKEIVSLLNQHGADAVGLCGKDANLFHAVQLRGDNGADLGQVGRITTVHYRVLQVLADAGMIPVVAPTATDPEGRTWNVNADVAAGEVASALCAEKLVFLTDTPGLLRDVSDPASLMSQVRGSDVSELRAAGIIAGGMIPKVEACLKALDYGVRKTHIIDGRVPHSLLLEIFTQRGLGTVVTH